MQSSNKSTTSMSDDASKRSALDLATTVRNIRNRSRTLRIQASIAIAVLIVAACAIAAIFMSLHRLSGTGTSPTNIRDPYDYRLMEARHEAIAAKLKELEELLVDSKQELLADKYGNGGTNHLLIGKLLQTRSDEMKNLRTDLESRLSKDRQNMYLEILQLRTERDRAKEDGAEKRSYIALIGEAVMRAGVLILAIYLIAIVSSIAKYWLRVADHLNSIADSIDLLRATGLDLQPAISALTPHAIDFQVDDLSALRSLKDLIAAINPSQKTVSKGAI